MGERYYEDFDAFWDFYVSQHMRLATRVLHWVGSTLGLVALALIFVGPWAFPASLGWVPIGLAVGYGFAWVSHFFIEHNKPATFLYPLWSFMGDWKMWGLMTTGQMHKHVARVQAQLDDGWQALEDRLAPPQDAASVG